MLPETEDDDDDDDDEEEDDDDCDEEEEEEEDELGGELNWKLRAGAYQSRRKTMLTYWKPACVKIVGTHS